MEHDNIYVRADKLEREEVNGIIQEPLSGYAV